MTCNWASNLSLTQFSTQSHGAWVLTRSICVPMPIAHRHENTKTYTRSITLRAHHYARTRCQKEETSAKVAWSVRSHSQRPSRLQNIPPQIWLRLCWSPARKSAEPLRAVSSLKVVCGWVGGYVGVFAWHTSGCYAIPLDHCMVCPGRCRGIPSGDVKLCPLRGG